MSLSILTATPPLAADADGVLRVGDTRVSLDSVIYAFITGATPEEIVQQYTTLDLADVYAVIAYFLQHRSEIEAYLKNRQTERDAMRQMTEARFDPTGVRARLLARRSDGAA